MKKATSFKFDKARHVYTWDGKPLTGVTTILSVIAKPALIQWAANETIKHISEALDREMNDGIEIDWPKLLEDARYAHRKKKEAAADAGTLFHAWAERWIKSKCKLKTLPKDPAAQKMAENFINWARANKVKFLASEKQVYSRNFWYAGTFDFLAEINGELMVGDIKTSTGIYGREYFAQMAGYQLALEEMEGYQDIKGRIVVRCGKDGSFETKVSYDYPTDRKIFLAALDLYRGLETFNK